MKNRILSLLLSFLMVVSLVSMPGYAVDETTEPSVECTVCGEAPCVCEPEEDPAEETDPCEVCGEDPCVCEPEEDPAEETDPCEICGEDPCVCEPEEDPAEETDPCEICGEDPCVCEPEEDPVEETDPCEVCGEDPCVCEPEEDPAEETDPCEVCGEDPCVCEDTPEEETGIPACSGAPVCWGAENGNPMNQHADGCARKTYLTDYVKQHDAQTLAELWSSFTQQEQTDIMAMAEAYTAYAEELKALINWGTDPEEPETPECECGTEDEVQYHLDDCPYYQYWVTKYVEGMTAEELAEQWAALDKNTRQSVLALLATHAPEKLEALEPLLPDMTRTLDASLDGIKVCVMGDIPEDVTLELAELSAEDYCQTVFDYIESADSVRFALDITLLSPDGTPWQPYSGEAVTVTLDAQALGLSEEERVRLLHDHEGEIEDLNIHTVREGKLTFEMTGFSSIYGVAVNEVAVNALDGVIYFDLNAGNVTISGSSYTGYRFDSTGTVQTVSGTLQEGESYYVYQSNASNKTQTGLYNTGTDEEPVYEMRLPEYARVKTADGEYWYNYIVDNDSTADVINGWKSAQMDGRTATGNYILITGEVNTSMTIENIWSDYQVGYNGGLNFNMLSPQTETSDMTIRLKGDNRVGNIYCARYGARGSVGTNALRFTDATAAGNSTLTVASYSASSTASRWASAIGAADGPESNQAYTGEHTTKLYFESGIVFAGTTIEEDTCAIGGGGNGTGTVYITGGKVTAVAYSTGATIGGGIGKSVMGGTGYVTITGGEVYAYNFSNFYNGGVIPGAAIGGGSSFKSPGSLGTVTIGGNARVYAQSVGGVAIGGGSSTQAGGGAAEVSITGNAEVTAISIDGIAGTPTADAVAGASIGGGNAGTSGNGGDCELEISGDPTIYTGSIGGGGKNNTTGTIGRAVVEISGGTLQGQVIMAKGAGKECSFTMTGGTVNNIGAKDSAVTVDKNGNSVVKFTYEGDTYTFVEQNGGAVYVENGVATLSGGTIQNTKATNGGAFYVTGGTFEMEGGRITATTAAEVGGAVCVVNGSVSITEGQIDAIHAPNGGAVAVNGGSFVMTGGSIEDFYATENGGAIHVMGGTAEVGGTLTGSASRTEAVKGGAVYVGGGSFTMTGGTISDCNAGEMGGAVCVEKTGDTSGSATITSGSIENVTAPQGGAVAVTGGSFAMTGGSITGVMASSDGMDPDGEGGAVYVKDGTASVSGGSITGDETAAEAASGGGVYVEGGSFTMTGGSMTNFNVTGNGGMVCVTGTGATATIQGGSISGNEGVNEAAKGGAVYVSAGGSFTINGDGSIAGCNATTSGGGVYLEDGTFTVSGGSFESCTAEENGGGVYLGGGSFTMSSGEFTACTAREHGGGVYLGGGSFTLGGDGSFENCTAAMDGGGVYLADGTFEMPGGSVKGCSAENGGGAYLAGGTFNMEGGSFEACRADEDGGAVCIMNGTANITDGTICGDNTVDASGNITPNNAEAVNGGGIYVGGGKLDMSNGTITKCSATSGGAAYITAGECFMTGGTVSCNHAQNGGGMYVVNTPVTYGGLNDITVERNYSAQNGGGMYIRQDSGAGGTLTTITSGSIDNNRAAGNGGGIYHTGDKGICTVSGTSSISGNTASNGGGLYIIDGSTLNVGGGHISENQAVGEPAADVTTAYDHGKNVGVGGGVYVGPGTTVKSSGFTMPEGQAAGIYSNTAQFAADDVYANVNATVVSLPNVSNMQLGEKLTATGWYCDYAEGDTKYNTNSLIVPSQFSNPDQITVERYRVAAEGSETTPYLVNSSLSNVQGKYICLTIGSNIINFGQIIINTDGGAAEDQYFVFRVRAVSLQNTALEKPDFEVTVRGNSSVTVDRVPFGTYEITEVEGWAWRYEVSGDLTKTLTVEDSDTPEQTTFTHRTDKTVAYDQTRNSSLWLDGNSSASVNVWNQAKAALKAAADGLLTGLLQGEEDAG